MTPQGKVRHEPLGRALQQYAGEQNREAMLSLLLPISRAAEASELIRQLVDSGEIYDPIAWSPKEAHEFLKAIPLFESSGLIVRVPDWWNAQKPARPRVNVKVNTKNSAGIGVDSLLDFSVGVSLDGETFGPDEIAQLLESSGGLIPLKGKWVEVDPEKLNEALTHWKLVEKDVHRDGISFFEGMRLLSGASLADKGEQEDEAAIREWTGLTAGPELDSILKGLRAPETRLEQAPPELKAALRPYQRTGYSWLRFVARRHQRQHAGRHHLVPFRHRLGADHLDDADHDGIELRDRSPPAAAKDTGSSPARTGSRTARPDWPLETGIRMSFRNRHGPAPSMRAASNSSSGIARNVCRNSRVAVARGDQRDGEAGEGVDQPEIGHHRSRSG